MRTCGGEFEEMHSLNNQGEPNFLVSSQFHQTRTTIFIKSARNSTTSLPEFTRGGALRIKAILEKKR